MSAPGPHTPLGAAAADLLRPLLRAVFACEEKARAGDPEEGIHDMRVASKRFREALKLFAPAFRRKDVRKHLRWVEALNDALGEVRDFDVLIEKLRARAKKVAEPGDLGELVSRMERARDGSRLWLLWHLDDIRAKERSAKLEAELVRVKARSAPHARTRKRGMEKTPLGEFAREEILERLAEVRVRWERVRTDAREKTFHRVRIANKHLRYSIEPFRAWLPGALREFYKPCSKLHDALGDLHDDDVFLHTIETAMVLATPDTRTAWEKLARDTTRRRARRIAKVMRIVDPLFESGWSAAETALREVPPTEPAVKPPPPEDAPAATPPALTPTRH